MKNFVVVLASSHVPPITCVQITMYHMQHMQIFTMYHMLHMQIFYKAVSYSFTSKCKKKLLGGVITLVRIVLSAKVISPSTHLSRLSSFSFVLQYLLYWPNICVFLRWFIYHISFSSCGTSKNRRSNSKAIISVQPITRVKIDPKSI